MVPLEEVEGKQDEVLLSEGWVSGGHVSLCHSCRAGEFIIEVKAQPQLSGFLQGIAPEVEPLVG